MKPLSSNSLFIGKVTSYLSKVDSTNAFANNLLSKSTPIEGTVIYTDNQYAGRGQIGSKWESSIGKNITMSVILHPKFLPIAHQFKLNQAIALAIYDLLSQYIFPLDQLRVKWPNDIYVGNKKIGGVLIENRLRSNLLASTVVGVGLNVNQSAFSPTLINPTSLILETGEEEDVYDMMGRFCECLEYRYLELKSFANKSGTSQQKYQSFDSAYLNVLYGYQEWRDFEIAATHQQIRGKITGIDSSGKLKIQTINKTLAFSFKEVIFLW
jgi:BirA family biotin operon repressor/biotin-[acetyl-CoA-carboxylase] ligase